MVFYDKMERQVKVETATFIIWPYALGPVLCNPEKYAPLITAAVYEAVMGYPFEPFDARLHCVECGAANEGQPVLNPSYPYIRACPACGKEQHP
jgi:hypothetical protein